MMCALALETKQCLYEYLYKHQEGIRKIQIVGNWELLWKLWGSETSNPQKKSSHLERILVFFLSLFGLQKFLVASIPFWYPQHYKKSTMTFYFQFLYKTTFWGVQFLVEFHEGRALFRSWILISQLLLESYFYYNMFFYLYYLKYVLS